MNINVRSPADAQSAVLDEAHVGHINGALGTILQGDTGPRLTWRERMRTLLAIIGPGLIVMVGDNDAGAFGTYAEAGQNYGCSSCGDTWSSRAGSSFCVLSSSPSRLIERQA